jgi:hypothetical protein
MTPMYPRGGLSTNVKSEHNKIMHTDDYPVLVLFEIPSVLKW